jgi:hypothetical protein
VDGLLAHQLLAGAQQGPHLLHRRLGHEACADQAVRQQIGEPDRVRDIGLASWHVLHMRGVGQDQGDVAVGQDVPDRLPLDAGSHYRDMGAAGLGQPGRQRQQTGRRGIERIFAHPAQYLVLREYRQAIEDAETRLQRLEQQIAELVKSWSMAPVIEAYQAMRRAAFLTAVTFLAEIGDVRRFDTPRQLMAYLGLVPSERSTGEQVRRGNITKGRQSPSPAGPYGGRLDVSLSGAPEPAPLDPAGAFAKSGVRNRLEGAGATMRPLSPIDGNR